jgi:hypothetical protein
MEQSQPPTAVELDFLAALEADASTQLRRLEFDDRVGRTRLLKFIHEAYTLELMLIAQMSRWYEIGLVTPQELAVSCPVALMIDLRARIQASPNVYAGSPAMAYTLTRMMDWWQANTIASSWRSLKAHVRVQQTPDDLANELADFLWSVREMLGASTLGDHK